MKHLLRKELLLTMHPTAPIFLALSAMVLIPSYPYEVIFFYTTLAIFFTCMNGRENNDVVYTLTLPVAKKDIVKARFAFAILLQLAQMLLLIPFAQLRGKMPMGGNAAGLDANIVLFGLGFLLYGVFNLVYFPRYYREVYKVGTSFLWGSLATFIVITAAQVAVHAVPFVRDALDTPDPQHLAAKCIALAVGLLLFVLLTAFAYKKSVQNFVALDL